MTSAVQDSTSDLPLSNSAAAPSAESPYSPAQIQTWLRGLLTVAWADGQFDDVEKSMIHTMVESEFAPSIDFATLEPIEPAALVALELSDAAAQNFLRMAVMVALADGVYSEPEDEQIMEFAEALSLDADALSTLRSTLSHLKNAAESAPDMPAADTSSGAASALQPPAEKSGIDPLKPARDWLDKLSVDDPRLARFVCKLVPSQCPFERDVKLFGRKVIHIPPMCKLNPLYEQLVGLRFRALCYLADDCGEDVSSYT
ncbi:MAG: Mo-dependent nitrogenase C-terminal domain-containing protein [Cyanobacteria bacterium J06634_5]